MTYGLDPVMEEATAWAWHEIRTSVEGNGNVLTVPMEKLRDAHNVKKLGAIVCAEIHSVLERMGIGHIPEDLPRYQDELVRLYKRATPIGNLIDAVLKPGLKNDSDLRRLFDSRTTRRTLQLPAIEGKADEM